MKSYPSEIDASPYTKPSDMVHIEAFKNGNNRALDEFYLLHRREFLKWTDKVFGLDAPAALDVYQDAMLVLYENIQRGKLDHLEASLKTYLFSVGKNLLLKRMSRQKSEKKRWEVVLNESDLVDLPEGEALAYEEEEKLEAVSTALQGLSPRNQSILKMYYYHKLPLKTIAEQLGYESVDVVKNQKVRCMKYLKRLVEGQLDRSLALPA